MIRMKGNSLKYSLALIAILFMVSMKGTDVGAEEFTLEKSIRIALENNHEIRIAEEKIRQAKGVRIEAFSGYLPKLNFMSYIAQKNESNIDPAFLPREFTAMIADKTYDMQFSVQQPVFTWGKIVNANRQAGLGYRLAGEGYRQVKNNLVLKVKKAYYGALLAQKMVSVSGEMLKVTEAHLKVTESFYSQGKVSGYDVSKAKVQMINVKTNLLKARNGRHLALELLFNTMGSELKDDVELTTEMEYSPVEVDYEKSVSEALSMRPEIETMELQKKMSKIALCLSRASNKPNLVLTGNLDWIQGVSEFEDISFSINDWYHTWNARLVLNYSLFDGFQAMGKVRQSKAQLSQVKIGREQLINGIKMEIRQACFNIKQSEELILAQKENVESAKDNLKTAQKRYEGGLVSDVEVRDAQLALSQSETNYLQALYDHNVAIASLNKALGR